ncbi:MAG: hypothetical protein JXR76_12100 [Deltaproteobacteria bacterium]|nr:hypothetical protein [Deltaproteobacteria bacterium]
MKSAYLHRIVVSFVIVLSSIALPAVSLGADNEENLPKWLKRNYLSLGWSSSVPLWKTLEETAPFSPIGASLSYQLRINRRFSIGPQVNWQLLEMNHRDCHLPGEHTGSSSSLNCWKERRLVMPSLVAHIYFIKRETMLPYLALGAGGMRVRDVYAAISEESASAHWQFQFAPEIGMFLLHGRIPVWISNRLVFGIPSSDDDGELMLVLTLGITVPN